LRRGSMWVRSETAGIGTGAIGGGLFSSFV
jgi:hypothetical protein